MFPVEPVTVTRTGVTIEALVDPRESRLYVKVDADIVRGDTIGFRGLTRRINEDPEQWGQSSVVVPYEDGPPFLPDLGQLYRSTPGGFDPVTKTYTEPGRTPIWTGPCSVKAESTIGSEVEVARQKVTVQPFSITVPLELVDVRPDDIFRVASARDPRLAGRDLVVNRVEGGSEESARVVRVTDNQG